MINLKRLIESKKTDTLQKVLNDMKKAKGNARNNDYAVGMKMAIELFEKTFKNTKNNNIDNDLKIYLTSLDDMIKKSKKENIDIWWGLDAAKIILTNYFTFGIYF